MNQAGPPARPRPGVVSASSYLLYLYALIQVISLALAIPAMNATEEALKELSVGMESLYTPTVYLTAGCTMVFVVALVVLAVFNSRGANGARITTWVLVGLMSCCGGLTLTNSLGGGVGPVTVSASANGQEVDPLADRLPWYLPVSTALAAVALIALLTAAILLATPTANAFFRKPGNAATPTGNGYPAGGQYPGYPQPGSPAPSFPPAQGYPPPQGPWGGPGDQR